MLRVFLLLLVIHSSTLFVFAEDLWRDEFRGDPKTLYKQFLLHAPSALKATYRELLEGGFTAFVHERMGRYVRQNGAKLYAVGWDQNETLLSGGYIDVVTDADFAGRARSWQAGLSRLGPYDILGEGFEKIACAWPDGSVRYLDEKEREQRVRNCPAGTSAVLRIYHPDARSKEDLLRHAFFLAAKIVFSRDTAVHEQCRFGTEVIEAIRNNAADRISFVRRTHENRAAFQHLYGCLSRGYFWGGVVGAVAVDIFSPGDESLPVVCNHF